MYLHMVTELRIIKILKNLPHQRGGHLERLIKAWFSGVSDFIILGNLEIKFSFSFSKMFFSLTWQISEYNDVQWRINTTAITVWHWRPGECQDSIFYSLLPRLVTWHGCNNSSTSMEISCPEEDICCNCWMTALSSRLMRRGSTSLLASSSTSRQLTGLTLVGGRSV